MGDPRSLVLITVDCLRADHVGFMGYDRPTTPFLDSLAEEALVFPTAIVGGAPTYYSIPAILASRHPLSLGRDLVGLAPEEPNLASVLQQSGYVTAFFGAANPYLSPKFGYDRGFDTFRDFLDGELAAIPNVPANGNCELSVRNQVNRSLGSMFHKLGPLGTLYDEFYFQYCQRVATPRRGSLDNLRRFPAADVVVDQARAWLASVGKSRFFLWLHLMDPHSPYYPTQKALGLMGQENVTPFRARYLNSYWSRSDLAPTRLRRYRQGVIALYDAGIRWVDTQVARLVETLRRFHLWDNCLFAFTADHGEEFLDHGGRYHPPCTPREEIIHVPLFLRAPGMRKIQLSKIPFSHVHLAPTLLDAIDAPVPAEFEGRSHWPQLQEGTSWDEPAIVESVASCTNPLRSETRVGPRVLTIRDVRYKLILQFDSGGEQLFDLEADPSEQNPLPRDAGKAARRHLLEHARQHLERSWQKRDAPRRLKAVLRERQLPLSAAPESGKSA